MVKSFPIAERSGIQMPFEYRTSKKFAIQCFRYWDPQILSISKGSVPPSQLSALAEEK